MTWVAFGLTVWVFGISCLLMHRAWYIKHRPLAWERRTAGFIAFSDKQRLLMLYFWPLTLIACVALVVIYLVLGGIEWIMDRYRER